MDALDSILSPPHPAEALSMATKEEKEADSFEWELISQTTNFLTKLAKDHPRCPHLSGNKSRTNRCSCLLLLKPLAAEDGSWGMFSGDTSPLQYAVASYMVWFVQQKREMQQSIIMGWLRYADASKKKDTPYLLSTLNLEGVEDRLKCRR